MAAAIAHEDARKRAWARPGHTGMQTRLPYGRMRWREPRVDLYDEAVVFRLRGELDRGRMDRAVRSCAMRYEDLPESGNIEDRRDQSGSVGGGFPGGGGFPLGRGGGLG